MFRNIKEYINNSELKITILEDKQVTFTKQNRLIKIIGKDLKLNKLLDQEVLVIGKILKVELNNE